MNITNTLKQFKNPSLLVVCGKVTAEIFHAHRGHITLIKSLQVTLPNYSDNEGFTMKHTKSGNLYKAGGLRKDTSDIKMQEDFKKELSSSLENFVHQYAIEDIFLFAPGYTTKSIRESWAPHIQKKVRRSIRGNYTNEHPLDVITKISTSLKQGKTPTSKTTSTLSKEAKKILSYGNNPYYQKRWLMKH